MKNKTICLLLSALAVLTAAGLSSCSCGGDGNNKSSKAAEILIAEETEPEYKDENGVGYNVGEDGNLSVVMVDKGVKDVVIPAEYNGKKITTVSQSSMKNSGIKSVTIAEGVTKIDDYAFALNKNLEKVNLPEGLVSIGNNAFFACGSLKEIALPSTLEEIGMFAFDASGVEEITIPKNVKTIGEYAFAESPFLKSFTLESGKTEVFETIFNKSPNVVVTAPEGSDIINIADKFGLKYNVK